MRGGASGGYYDVILDSSRNTQIFISFFNNFPKTIYYSYSETTFVALFFKTLFFYWNSSIIVIQQHTYLHKTLTI